MKKIIIGSKPTGTSIPTTPDDWVSNRPVAEERMKRLTIDIPISLHVRVKSMCALKGDKMADVVRELLVSHFGNEYQEMATGDDPASN